MILHASKNFLLFSTFFKIGLFTIGGGYAMIPLIQEEVVEKLQWISKEDMLDIIVVAESTPGPLAINTATFIGYKQNKLMGSILATLGVVLPSFLIIYAISFFYTGLLENQLIAKGFLGLKSGVVVLLCNALLKMSSTFQKNPYSILLFFIIFALAFFTNIGVIYLIIFSVLFSLLALKCFKGGKE